MWCCDLQTLQEITLTGDELRSRSTSIDTLSRRVSDLQLSLASACGERDSIKALLDRAATSASDSMSLIAASHALLPYARTHTHNNTSSSSVDVQTGEVPC
jgi:hypothetical protein